MKQNYLEDVLFALENEQHEVVVDKDIAKRAILPIEKMIAIQNNA